MIEFFTFSSGARIFITFILGICVLTQTMTLVLNFYSHRLTTYRVFENLLEIAILGVILLYAILHGQVVNAYKNGFLVPTGFENIRILIFLVVLILVVVLSVLNRSFLPLSLIPTTIILLPIMENVIGYAYPWFFLAALIFFIARSIKICVSSFIEIATNISALSVINAIDTLHTGVLFSEKDGYTLLSNFQMQNLMFAITGRVFRNSLDFYDMLVSDQYESRYKKAELDKQIVYLLPDGDAWMFTKRDIFLRRKKYIHITAADVSEQWSLTAKLQDQNQELRYKSDKLKQTIANLHILSKQKEIENAKMRAHDILGQRLTVLLRTIQNEHDLDHDLLISLSKGIFDELKAEQSEASPYDQLKSIQNIFAAIGVDIRFDGQLPDNYAQAHLFVDIIREGSTNAVRHGLATQINIKVEAKENAPKLTITNNGHTTTDPIIPGSGIGVMKNKVNGQGGNLNIIQHPIFTLSVLLPGGEQI